MALGGNRQLVPVVCEKTTGEWFRVLTYLHNCFFLAFFVGRLTAASSIFDDIYIGVENFLMDATVDV